jgi:hypothetical protein
MLELPELGKRHPLGLLILTEFIDLALKELLLLLNQ